MSIIRVNGDYELELFHKQKGPKVLNETLEFLAFFLNESSVISTREYSDEYLSHVQSITGHRPQIVHSGRAENWWGPLKTLEHERWMNSKLTSAAFNESVVLNSPEDFTDLGRPMLVKYAFGMSGKGIQKISSVNEIRQYPCILEPYFERIYDFSHYIYPDGKVIAYENFIDEKFQYRGTLFQNYLVPTLENLRFKVEMDISPIRSFYESKPLQCGYSIDSFLHTEGVRELSEVNYRRTMGRCAYELSARIMPELQWSLLILGKMDKHQLIKLPQIFHLTPEGGRFEAFLIKAENSEQGRKLLNELRSYGQFTIQI